VDGNGIVPVFEFRLQPSITGEYGEDEDTLKKNVRVEQTESVSSRQVDKRFQQSDADTLSLPGVLDQDCEFLPPRARSQRSQSYATGPPPGEDRLLLTRNEGPEVGRQINETVEPAIDRVP
jgi:hypothetical protein